MKVVAYSTMLMLAVTGLAILGCEQPTHPNHAPTITELDIPTDIDASLDATLTCTATDPDTDALTFNWTCTNGDLHTTTGYTVVWTAPESSGTATITVTAQDDSGAADTMSGTITINSVTKTLVDWTGAVAGGEFKLWSSAYIPARYTVSGTFSVEPLDATFLMLDSANYQKWRFSEPYDAVIKVEKSTGSDFSTVVTVGTGYHFVLDNVYNVGADTLAHVLVQQTSP
ncbi:hypothetical protein JXD38_01110 [candidate division WOR-3 bacterium]|nr:hypothetical protein [candidate division WOR-3 bacterium]